MHRELAQLQSSDSITVPSCIKRRGDHHPDRTRHLFMAAVSLAPVGAYAPRSQCALSSLSRCIVSLSHFAGRRDRDPDRGGRLSMGGRSLTVPRSRLFSSGLRNRFRPSASKRSMRSAVRPGVHQGAFGRLSAWPKACRLAGPFWRSARWRSWSRRARLPWRA